MPPSFAWKKALICLCLGAALSGCSPSRAASLSDSAYGRVYRQVYGSGDRSAVAPLIPAGNDAPPTGSGGPTRVAGQNVVLPRTSPNLALTPGPFSVEAETPAPFAATPTLDYTCVFGGWSPADLAGSIQAVNARRGSPFTVDEVNGSVVYTFTRDHHLEIRFNNLSVRMSGRVDGSDITVVEQMRGAAVARYLVVPEKNWIELSEFGGNGIRFAVVTNGQTLVEGNFPAWQAFSNLINTGRDAPDAVTPPRAVDLARVSVRCSGNDMLLQALDPLPGPLVKLQKK